MKKYFMEFLGTFFFVLGIIGAISSASVLTPLYIGLTLAVVVYMCGSVSGGHVNPAVTVGLLVNKKIAPQEAVKYIVAQCIGAVFAYGIAKILGITPPAVQLVASREAIFLAEFLFTFALVSMVYFVAVNKATTGNSYFGLAIGLIVTVGAVTVGKISGGFFNPAVLLGLGLSGISIKIALIILSAQSIGAIGAAGVYRYVIGK